MRGFVYCSTNQCLSILQPKDIDTDAGSVLNFFVCFFLMEVSWKGMTSDDSTNMTHTVKKHNLISKQKD